MDRGAAKWAPLRSSSSKLEAPCVLLPGLLGPRVETRSKWSEDRGRLELSGCRDVGKGRIDSRLSTTVNAVYLMVGNPVDQVGSLRLRHWLLGTWEVGYCGRAVHSISQVTQVPGH